MSFVSSYSFTIANGQVTGVKATIGGTSVDLKIPTNTTFTVSGTTITATVTGTNAKDVIQFVQDPANANLYHVAGDTSTVTSPTTIYGSITSGYQFTITGGKVTDVLLTHGATGSTHSHDLGLPPAASFAVSGSTVTETRVIGNALEKISFVASGSAGLYAVASVTDTFAQQGSSTTALWVDPDDRVKFTFGSGTSVSTVTAVLADNSTKAVTIPSSTTFTQLAAGYVLQVSGSGSSAHYNVWHDGNGDGVYTEVAHGSGATIDLVGLKAQISAPMDLLL